MSQHEWLDTDFYRVLGVDAEADQKDITKAYRKLAREYHPDANPGDTAAEERFKEISAAYDVVGDETKRAEYDEIRRLGPMAGGFGRATGGGRAGGGGFQFDGVDLSDLLGGMFGGGGRRGQAAGPRPGDDLEARLHLSFDDAVNGVTTSVHLTSDAPCSTCHGSGARPGTTPASCSRCGGRGVLDDNQGMFSFSQPCPQCRGRGRVVTDPCPTCRGNGMERRPRQVKVRIPAGVKDGQRIRLKGRGGPGSNGGPAGDLHVTVDVAGHEVFGRKGDHLTIDVPITYAEAALGGRITVPTIDGDTVRLKVPAGTPTGKTFRVKGRGIEASSGSTGDLLVTVVVHVPTKVSDREREAIEALAEVGSDPGRDRLLHTGGDAP